MKVLFVEDDENLAEAVKTALRGKGLGCDVADMGQQAVGMAKANGYDIVVLDLGLPDMDGFHVMRMLKVEGIETPVLLQSGLTGADLRTDDGALDDNDFLPKPFNIAELVERMEQIVSRARGDFGFAEEPEPGNEHLDSQPRDREEARGIESRRGRQQVRTPAVGSALIVGSDGKTIPCTLVDISEGGCALQLIVGNADCPTLFTLYTEEPKRQWTCELRWRKRGRIGVEFQ